MELVGEIFLSHTGRIRNMGCIPVSAKSGEIVCRFHAAPFVIPADMHEYFLDCILCTDVSLESWKCSGLKERRAPSRQDFRRIIKCKKYILLGDGILILGVFALAFLSSVKALVTFMLSSAVMVFIVLFVRKWVRENGSGDNRDDWITYLVGVFVAYMILIPLCNGVATHFFGEEELDTGRKQTIFASYEKGDSSGKSADNPVGVTVYTSPIPWIINKTSKCYPRNLTNLWDQTEMEVPAELGALPEDMEISWYRYMVRKDVGRSDTKEKNPQGDANAYEPEPAVDEVILKDKNKLVVLDYGGGTNEEGIKEAVDAFVGGNVQ